MFKIKDGTLQRFLKNHYTLEGQNWTHTRIGNRQLGIQGGKFTILAEDILLFYKLVGKEILTNNGNEYLTERQNKNGPILVDLDFRYEIDIMERQHDSSHIDDIITTYFEKLKKIIQITQDTEIPVYIFEKPNINVKQDVVKDGIHIIIGINLTHQMQKLLREEVLVDFGNIVDSLPIKNDWTKENIIDDAITSGKNPWQMYGSRKPQNEAYKLVSAYVCSYDEDNELEIERNTEEILALRAEELLVRVSAQNTTHHKFEITEYAKGKINILSTGPRKKPKKKRRVRQNVRINLTSGVAGGVPLAFENISSEEDVDKLIKIHIEEPGLLAADYTLKEIHAYTMVLGKKYYDPYDNWIRVGWGLHNTDYRLFLTWVKFSSKSHKFSYDEVGEMYRRWIDMRDEGITSASIIWWAQQENLEAYQKIKKTTIDFYIEQTIRGKCDADIAMVLYQLFKGQYVHASHKHKIWYVFQRHRWVEIEEGTTLRRKLSTDLSPIYQQKVQALVNHLADLCNGALSNDEIEKYKTKSKSLTAISMGLRTTAKKNCIMKEAAEIFYEKGFVNKLDKNPFLIGVKNGVIDFKKREFRTGMPEDYLSLSIGIDYVKYDPNDDDQCAIKSEIDEFMAQLFPQESLRKYMWEHLASALIGTNENQTFNIYTGGGRNGKSKLVELMGKILGDYKKTVPITLLTQKRSGIGSVSPEIAQLKGCRFAVMQEPCKEEKINTGIMKEITGGDPIQGRSLHKDTVTFVPQFNLAVCTNHLFNIRANDDGTWRRIRVVPFISKFVKDPSADPQDHEFIMDKNINLRFPRWTTVFLALLVEIAYETQGEVEDCEIVMARCNKYRKSQDYLTEFFEERVIKCEGQKMMKGYVFDEFRRWFSDNYGHGVPKGKELHNFLEKKCGKYKNGWRGWRVLNPEEEHEDGEFITPNNI